MFEIRVICDTTDTDRITASLDEAFSVSPVITCVPTRDGKQVRLYATANHRATHVGWPTPDDAYAGAPAILDELEWVNRTAAETGWDEELDRQYFLRKAAVFDRIAVSDVPEEYPSDPAGEEEVAAAAAVFLLDYDKTGRELYGGVPYPPGHPAAEADPRGYVRQEYALWSVCTCDDSSEQPCLKHPSS